MSTDVKVPASGESVTSANVARWHKANGDIVHKGDTLVTLETDKVSNELEAAADGVLEILVGEGEEVPIGALIARIGGSASSNATVTPAPAAVSSPVASAPAAVATPANSTSGTSVEIRVPAAGESVTSANVASWRKKDGDAVSKGEVLVVLETDKVSNELEAPASGTLKILIPEGEEVGIGTLIATVDTTQVAVTPSPAPPSTTPAAQKPAAPAPAVVKPIAPAPPSKPSITLPAAPMERETTSAITEGRPTRRNM
ncbi:MAG: biotin/lipoyl-containing protein, partial [Luteolibacter sp.]